MDFQQALREYVRLRRLYQTGQIPAEAFEKKVNSMLILDDQGRKWMIGVKSGKWYRHDGSSWVQENPSLPSPTPIVRPTPPVQVVQMEEHKAVTQEASLAPAVPRWEEQKEIRLEPAPVQVAHVEAQKADSSVTPLPIAAEKKPRSILGTILITLLILLACAGIIWVGLILTGTIKSSFNELSFRSATTSAIIPTASLIPPATPTSTQTIPTTTATATSLPFDISGAMTGSWSAVAADAFYHFYSDSSFVFFNKGSNQFQAGSYKVLPGNQVQFDIIVGEEIIQTFLMNIGFPDENDLLLTASDGTKSTWARSVEETPGTSRKNDPLAVLFELANRFGWSTPVVDCGFDLNDEETSFRFVCLSFDKGLSITWVDQAPSIGTDRKMERNLLTINIDHQSEATYQEEYDYVLSSMEPTGDFHGLQAYNALTDMGWFIIEDYAWFDGPWIYSLLRVNSKDSPNPSPELLFAAETIYEILQGEPPKSNPATIPTERSQGSFLYAQEIIGTWLQRHPSQENLEFKADGALQVSSEPGNYSYSGTYTFTDDHHVTFELTVGTVETEITIEGSVMTLLINGVESIYDRVK